LFEIQPILENKHFLLRPAIEEDLNSLFKVAANPKLWEQHPAKERATLEGFTKFFKEGLESKGMLVLLDKASNEIIGSSRFKFLSKEHSAVEIGWTFLAEKHWGGSVNGQMKKLMIAHAHQFVRNVLLFIDKQNIRSYKAAEKIGAIRLGEKHPLHCLQKTDNHCTYLIERAS